MASPAQNFWGLKCLTSGEQQYFCVGLRFSKHKMTRYVKNSGGHGSMATPMSQFNRKEFSL